MSEQRSPNILHIVRHDLGTWLGCYGHHDVRSPNLDRLAAEGVRFTHHFAASTCCSPARGCTMTGRYAHTNGLIGLVNLGWSLPEEELTLVDYCRQAGYQTVHAGLQHERRTRSDNRYAAYLDTGSGRTSTSCDVVCDAVADFFQERPFGAAPFYLNAGFSEVHAPWNDPRYHGQYDPAEILVPPFLPDTPFVRRQVAAFYGSITFMDECIGHMLGALDDAGLADDTVVVFTTDHGISFPRAKETLYDPGIHTTLLIKWPARIQPNSVCDHLISSIDLVPTLLDVIAQPIPDRVQGTSFWPLLSGGGYVPRDALFSERNFHCYFDPNRSVRTRRYKYIRNLAERGRMLYPWEAQKVSSLRDVYRRDLSGEVRPEEQLFDLEEDPNEFHNLAGDGAYARVLADLRARVGQWMTETSDFMRSGAQIVAWPDLGDWDVGENGVIPPGPRR